MPVIKFADFGVSVVAQWLTNPNRNHEVAVRSLALLSVLRIWRCHDLWCRLQMWLGSGGAVAMAQADGYSSNWTPSLETSICLGSSPRNSKKTKKKKKNTYVAIVMSNMQMILKTTQDAQHTQMLPTVSMMYTAAAIRRENTDSVNSPQVDQDIFM